MFDKEKFLKAYFAHWSKAMENNLQLYSSTSKIWTAFHMEKILYPLAEELSPKGDVRAYKRISCEDCKKNKCPSGSCGHGETWSQEFYRVDLGLYRFSEEGFWSPDFLIEHENQHFKFDKHGKIKNKGWFAEFLKLLPMNCSDYGARVIISYADFEGAETGDHYREFLLRTLNENEIVKSSLCYRPILIILGPSNRYIKTCKPNQPLNFYFLSFDWDGQKWLDECRFIDDEKIGEIFKRIQKLK